MKMAQISKASCKIVDSGKRLVTNNDDYTADDSTLCRQALVPGLLPETIPKSLFSLPELDLTEEPVKFTVPLLHSKESVTGLSEEERKYLTTNEVIIKTGRYAAEEDAILKRNFENFIKRFGVNDPVLLLGLGKKCRNGEVQKFLKAKHFYVRLGKDLNDRPLRNIYLRARLLFDPSRGKGKFDDEEITHLKKLHDIVGNKWAEIGNHLDRNANTARSAFLWHDKRVITGKWTSEERCNLIKAIEVVAGTKDLSKVQSDMIPWENVAKLVPTRNYFQCRLYWLEDLSWTLKEKAWTRNHYSKLISILCRDCYVEDFSEVDWKRVQKCFFDLTGISISWVFLRKKFYSLKRYISPEPKRNYKEVLKFVSIKYGVDPPF